MRNSLLTFSLLLLSLSIYSQDDTLSTEIQSKKALLEVFTGIHCAWCSQGDLVSSHLLSGLNGQVYVTDIHAGTYAEPGAGEPDYTTAAGDSIHSFFYSLEEQLGYPSGMINRHKWEDGHTVLNRNNWGAAVKDIIAEKAPLNLHQRVDYDGNTHILTIKIGGYFTTDTLIGNMRLSIALTQDNITGIQNGSDAGDNYVHMHMLRDYITPTLGDSLGTGTKGKRFYRIYTYQVPESYKNIPVKPEDIEIISFVTSKNGEILNAVSSKPKYVNYGLTLSGELLEPDIPIGTKYGYHFFEAKLKNHSAYTITSATFEITVNGETVTKTIDTDINQFEQANITIPVSYTYASKGKTYYTLKLTKLNETDVETCSLSGSFNTPKITGTTIYVQIMTDVNASQNHFYLKNADGKLIREFGPYPDGIAATYKDTLTVEDGKTYCIEVTDSYGDGLNDNQKGGLILHSSYGSLIDQFYQINGYGTRSFFIVDQATWISPIKTHNDEKTYIYTAGGQPIQKIIKNGFYIIKRGNIIKKMLIK